MVEGVLPPSASETVPGAAGRPPQLDAADQLDFVGPPGGASKATAGGGGGGGSKKSRKKQQQRQQQYQQRVVNYTSEDADADFAAFKHAESLDYPPPPTMPATATNDGVGDGDAVVVAEKGVSAATASSTCTEESSREGEPGSSSTADADNANDTAATTPQRSCGDDDTGAGAVPAAVDPSSTAITAAGGGDLQRRFVSPKDFELLKVIGMGAFGKVLQVREKHTRKILAMKVISKRLLRRKSGYIENIQAERDILTRVKSPFVVAMHCSFQTRDKLFLVMDFLAGGELFLRIGREGIFLEREAAFYLSEIILALDHLHNLGILHRDLKPENILLGSDGHLLLTDFGLAKDCSGEGGFRDDDDDNKRASTICGTQEYMAPEMIARQGYSRAADYWSLGCISYEMLSGLPPFSSKQGAKELFRKIMSERVKMPPGSTSAACKLLKGLLNRDVQKRWGTAKSTMFEVGGVAGLKMAEFFKGIDWDKLERKEIEPPMVMAVQGEEDLKHFHDEFTTMPLPRSVVEMSKDHFRPHRVKSETFRGFSFIQEDYNLPERAEEELQSYWDAAQEDGESVSDCASSKMDGESGRQQPADSAPEKKKRPPRKRKKKKNNADATAGNTPIHSTATTPAPSVSNDDLSENGDNLIQDTVTAPPATTPDRAVPATVKKPFTNTRSPPSLSVEPPPKPKPAPALATKPRPKPAQKTWQNVSSAKKKPVKDAKGTPQSNRPSQPAAAQQRVGGPTYTPPPSRKTQPPPSTSKPRGWEQTTVQGNAWNAPATAAPSSDWRQHGRTTTPAQHQPPRGWGEQPPPPPPTDDDTQPSSDWRRHSMSPSPRSAKSLRNIHQPLNQEGGGGGQQPSWPVLDIDDPPLTSNGASAAKPSTTKLHGAWASRTKR